VRKGLPIDPIVHGIEEDIQIDDLVWHRELRLDDDGHERRIVHVEVGLAVKSEK